jgi:hypothetical protein
MNISVNQVTGQPLPFELNRNQNETIYFILYGTGFYKVYSQVSCHLNGTTPPSCQAGIGGATWNQINIWVTTPSSAGQITYTISVYAGPAGGGTSKANDTQVVINWL